MRCFDGRGAIAALALLVTPAATLAQDSSQDSTQDSTDEGLPPPALATRPASSPASTDSKIDTGFDPKKDAPLFVNTGNYANPGGDCLGMSLVAVANFLERQKTGQAADAPGTRIQAGPHPTTPVAGDPVEHEVTAAAQWDASIKDVKHDSIGRLAKPSDPALVNAALERMRETGQPQLLLLRARIGKVSAGHATVLFGAADGKLRIYDPNYPGETIEWPFDPKKGLGPHPKAAVSPAFYGHISLATALPFDRFAASRDMAAIREACTSGAKDCKEGFASVRVKASPEAGGAKVLVSGSVERGLARTITGAPTDPPARVYLRIDGKLRDEPVRLARDGSFSVAIPASLLDQDANQVQVIAASRLGLYSGHGAIEVGRGGEALPVVPAGERQGIAEALGAATGPH